MTNTVQKKQFNCFFQSRCQVQPSHLFLFAKKHIVFSSNNLIIKHFVEFIANRFFLRFFLNSKLFGSLLSLPVFISPSTGDILVSVTV